MPFMPFQILAIWLRGLLSLAILATGISLLVLWYNHREVAQPVAVERIPTGDPTLPPLGETTVRYVPWQFGWNPETAYLLGGLALVSWSFVGGWVSPQRFRRAGQDEPQPLHASESRRILREDGSELHVEFFGSPEHTPIVLSHGWGLDSEEWYYAKKQLADRYRLIEWDLPGLGKSKGPRDNDWSLEKMAHDLHAVVSLAGNRPVILLGHSIGGMIILTYCKLYPEELAQRIQGLILAHSTYTNPVKTTSMASLYTALQKPLLEPLCHLMIWLAPLVWVLNALSYLNGSAHRSTERSSFSGRETRGQLDFLSRYILTSWPAVIARGMLGMFRYDATPILGTLPVPALIVSGDRDTTCLPEASAYMSRAIPMAKLLQISDARHCGIFEHYQRFDVAVAEFVTQSVPALSHKN